jgi:hypothetical protein
MGAARLLARAWIVFGLYATGLAAKRALDAGLLPEFWQQILVCALLFGAMGLLFVAGYGLSSGLSIPHAFSRLKPVHLTPGFNDLVFVAFTLLAFFVQTSFAPTHPDGSAVAALSAALRFAVFGQHVLEDKLATCGLDSGRALASAFVWLLAFIFIGSTLSRIRLAAGLVRLERKARPEALGSQALALALGLAAIIGVQAFYVGTAYTLLPCRGLGGLSGDILIGLGPLGLAYSILAALTNLIALNPEA